MTGAKQPYVTTPSENFAERETQVGRYHPDLCQKVGAIHRAYGWSPIPRGEWDADQTDAYLRGFGPHTKPPRSLKPRVLPEQIPVGARRMHIHQPNPHCFLHALHGANVMACRETGTIYQVFFLAGDVASARIPSDLLRDGFIGDAE